MTNVEAQSEVVEVRESEDLVLPVTGEVVDISDAVACGAAFDELSQMVNRIYEAKRILAEAIAAHARVLGTKSLALPGGRKAVITGGPEKAYDAEAIERELRQAGMPEDRIREVIREEVRHTLRVREASRAAGANEEYATIINRNTTEVARPYSVAIRRT